MSDACERFFFVWFCCLEKTPRQMVNSIFCSVLPPVYFIYEMECRRWSVFNRVISKPFYRYCRHCKTRKLRQLNETRTLTWNRPKMKGNTVATILLVSFLVACLMVDETYGIVGILGAGRNSPKRKQTSKSTQSQQQRPSSQRNAGMRASSFERKRPDRFPEGPMFDKRSRNRFYNY